MNLFAFVQNDSQDQSDLLGLDQIKSCGKVYWGVEDSGGNVVKWYQIGTLPVGSGPGSYPVSINAEFGGFTRDLIDLGMAALSVDSRFGYLDSLPEEGQKAGVKLAIKHPATPTSFTSLDEAGIWGSWLARGKSQGNGFEWGGWIKKSGGGWILASTTPGGSTVSMGTSGLPDKVRIWVLFPYGFNPKGINGWFHNHPGGAEGMSDGDHDFQNDARYFTMTDDDPALFSEYGYVLTPKGIVDKTDGSAVIQVFPAP